jgi:ubiquinone/menaquinone biosynthesis C-methylase UbiE
MPEHVCPWWVGYLLASPIRRLWQKPETILEPYIKPGMTALDVGPGMGYFTLPMARMVGDSGRVVCVDVQERMLKSLMRRARRAGLEKQIVTRVASADSLGITDYAGQIDFVLAFAVVHEVPNQENLFREIHAAMKPGAQLLISEPTGHVTKESFEEMLAITKRVGFETISTPEIKRGISVLLRKKL